MSAEKELISRPVEPTPAWTFVSAFSALRAWHYTDALDEFLLYNKDVLLQPMPFHTQDPRSADPGPGSGLKHFQLRGVLYEGASDENIALARKLASWLNVNVQEVLRIILQTKKRIPEESHIGMTLSPELLYSCAVLRERATVLDIARDCFRAHFRHMGSLVVRNIGKSYIVDGDYVQKLVEGLQECFRWVSTPETRGFSAEQAAIAREEVLLHILGLLRFLHALLLESADYASPLVEAWFDFAKMSDFGAAFVQDASVFGVISKLITVISLKLLELQPKTAVSAPYFNDVRVFSSVVSVVVPSANSIVKYGLLLSLHKKAILLEERPDQNASFLDSKLSLAAIQKHSATLQAEVGTSVFSEIRQLSEYFDSDDDYNVALVELILAALPVLNMNDQILSCIAAVLQKAPDLSVETFFDSPDAQQLFILARAKFPMIMVPFLKMAAINGDFGLHELEEMRSYMQAFDAAQFSRLYEIDSENTNLVRLSSPIDVYPQYEVSKKLSLLLKQDTKAQVFQPEDPHTVWVTFLYKYNGWAFIGRVLDNICKTFDASNTEKMDLLSSILNLIREVTRACEPVVLEYMSAYTDDTDISDVLFRLLEQCLHHRNSELSAVIFDTLSSLMPIITSRIWAYLSTSSLFSRQGREGFASIIFGSLEMGRGDYSFTVRLAYFALDLTENCLPASEDYPQASKAEILAHITQHLIQVFSASCNYNDGHQKLQLVTLLLDVFSVCLKAMFSVGPETVPESKPTRVFAPATQQILDAFLLGNNDASSPIFESIDSLASFSKTYELTDKSGAYGDIWALTCLKFSKLLIQTRNAAGRPPSVFEKRLFRKLPELVMIYAKEGILGDCVLDLLSALSNGKWPSGTAPSMLSHLGRSHSRILLHSLAADLDNPFDDENTKIPIYKFLCSLMEANQQGLSVFFMSGRDVFGEFSTKPETPRKSLSLLSILKRNINDVNYLSPAVTVHLLDAVSLAFSSWNIGRDEESDYVFVQELISMMANFDKEAEKTEKNLISRNSSRDFSVIEGNKIVSEKWGLFDGLYQASYHCKLYAKIAETLSLLLFTSKNEKCKGAIVEYLRGPQFAARIPEFFSISNYNTTLFDEVNERFSAMSPNYQLSDFAVTFKERNHFGFEEVFDVLVLDAMFDKHAQWGGLRDQIIHCAANMQYYNAQFSLARAVGGLVTTFCRRAPKLLPESYSQAALQLLTIPEPRDAYTQDFFRQQNFGKIELAFLLLYTGHCNGSNFSSEAISIVEAGLELMGDENVGYLNFDTHRTSEYSYRSLLRIIYVSLSQIGQKFDLIALNHQILMRVFDFVVARGVKGLIVQLENHVYLSRKQPKPSESISTTTSGSFPQAERALAKLQGPHLGRQGVHVLEDKAQSRQNLLSGQHIDSKSRNLPNGKESAGQEHENAGDFVGEALGDFELILSIVKLFTQMKLSRALQSEIMDSLRQNKTVEAICSLHTFSHLVLVGNNEPVFAQLSLMFIQQFLSLDEFRENLGAYNLFTVIRESVISRPFKDGGVSVETNVQLHRNWINGVLPIMVTCLAKHSELQQVMLTIRAFQKQVEFCAESWTRDSASLQVSTAGTFETMQILYMFKILHGIMGARGISVDSATDVDMSILPGFDTPQKRAHFADFVNNLLKHPKFLASRIVPSSKEEELLLSRSDERSSSFVRALIDDISELKALVS